MYILGWMSGLVCGYLIRIAHVKITKYILTIPEKRARLRALREQENAINKELM